MSKLLDRLKQGLRNLGRGQTATRPVPPQTVHAREDAPRDTRLRSELDAAPAGQRQPAGAPAPRPAKKSTKKAALANAHRQPATRATSTIWGPAPGAAASLFEVAPPSSSGIVLTGSIFALAPDSAPPSPQQGHGTALQSGSLLGASAADPSPGASLFGPAPSLTPGDDSNERLF